MEKIRTFVINQFKNDKSGHGLDHIGRVSSIAKELSLSEGGDIQKVELLAVLHEALDYKFIESAELARERVYPLLKEKFSHEECEELLFELENISFKGGYSKPLRTLEGKIVQDADRLDSIGAIGIARAFYYAGYFGEEMHNMTKAPLEFDSQSAYLEYIKEVKGTTINHFYEKLLKVKGFMNTESGKNLAVKRHAFLELFLENFLSEWV